MDSAAWFEIERLCSSFCTESILIEPPVALLAIAENILRDGFRIEADAAQQGCRLQ